jgi:hypothetical protein
VTKSQKHYKNLQKTTIEFIQEYGDSAIMKHSFNGKSLLVIGTILESRMDNLLSQFILQSEILDEIEDAKLLRHSAAMNYVSLWTHLPYL